VSARPAGRTGAKARAGFTLLEVMVALTVMGVVLVGARTLLGQIADDADRITAASADADREANAEALLRTVAGRLELSPPADGNAGFEGTPRGMRFHTWCEVPDGWLERCRASLGFVETNGEPLLALRLSTGETVPLRRGFAAGELVYLRDAAAGGDWVRDWGASLTAPLAVGVVIDGDTAIVAIGERG
jgi:prepilin-type N-terminal cleavage/methylation domain-containing protein